MYRALLVETKPQLRTLYSLNLNIYAGTEVHLCSDHIDVFDHLKSDNEINLIITRFSVKDDETAKSITKYLKREERNIPIIVLGNGNSLDPSWIVLDETPEVRSLVRASAKALGVNAEIMASLKVPDPYPIPIDHFRDIKSLVCDVFESRMENGNEVYDLKYKKGFSINSRTVEYLKKNGLDTLYVPAINRIEFATTVTENLITFLGNQNLSVSDRIDMTDQSLIMLSEQMKTCGLTHSTIRLAQESIMSIEKVVEGSQTLKALLENLSEDKHSFRYMHCQMLTFICHHIVRNMEWGTKEQQDKLGFVAFFHDIVLETDDEARIRDESDIEASVLTPQRKEVVRKHALLAANLVKDFPRLPLGAEIIIKQHHGSRTGVGLSENSSGVSPLAIVFVVAEEWVQCVLDIHDGGRKASKDEVMKYLRGRFKKKSYLKIVETLSLLDVY